jgi:hypothetical protein
MGDLPDLNSVTAHTPFTVETNKKFTFTVENNNTGTL